jgi:hypothetical protein
MTADASKELDILFVSKFDDKGAKDAAKSLGDINKNTEGAAKQSTLYHKNLQDSVREASSLKTITDSILKTAVSLGVTGTAATIFTAISSAAKSYVATMNSSTQLSRNWMAAQTQLEDSYNRMGKVATGVLLPYMQKAADLSSKAASFVEAHPAVVQYAAQGAGVLAAVGAVGSGIMGVKTLQKVIGAFPKGGTAPVTPTSEPSATPEAPVEPVAAPEAPVVPVGGVPAAEAVAPAAETAEGTAVVAGAGGVTLAGILASVGGGLVLGGLVDQALANSKFNQSQFAKKLGIGFAPMNQVATVADYELNKLFGAPEDVSKARANQTNQTASAVINAPQNIVTAIQNAVKTVSAPAQVTQQYPASSQQLEAYRQFLLQMSRAQEDYQHTALLDTNQFNLSQLYATQDYQKQVSRAAEQFQMSEAMTEKEFYRQRAISNRDFNIQMKQSEEDYQLSVTRNAEDHKFDLFQIALTGDAMQYYLAQRQYNISTQRAAQDHTIQVNRADQSHQLQLQDNQQSYNIEKAYRDKMQKLQIQYNQQDFDISQSRAKQQFQIQLNEMDYQYKLQNARSRQDFTSQILPTIDDEAGKIDYLIHEMGTTAVNGLTSQLDAMEKTIQNLKNQAASGYSSSNPGGPNMPGSYQEGGYTAPGMAYVHSGEFVLTQPATSAAEKVVGTSLSQQNVLEAMLGGGSNGGTLVYQPQFAADTSAETRNAANREAVEMFIKLLPRR